MMRYSKFCWLAWISVVLKFQGLGKGWNTYRDTSHKQIKTYYKVEQNPRGDCNTKGWGHFYLWGVKKVSGNVHNTGSCDLLGILFKISDKHPHLFCMEVVSLGTKICGLLIFRPEIFIQGLQNTLKWPFQSIYAHMRRGSCMPQDPVDPSLEKTLDPWIIAWSVK